MGRTGIQTWACGRDRLIGLSVASSPGLVRRISAHLLSLLPCRRKGSVCSPAPGALVAGVGFSSSHRSVAVPILPAANWVVLRHLLPSGESGFDRPATQC
ncbi:unnamed protein product [Urochloa humidicola]